MFTLVQGTVLLILLAFVLLLDQSRAMITPLFSVDQDDASITITMRTPYIKADELELDVTGSAFRCHVRPYYLSLNFKQRLQEGGEKARWDVDRNEMTVVIPKAIPGQHFDNLDMLTSLLTQPKKQLAAPSGNGIEVLEESIEDSRVSSGEEDEDELGWEIPQKIPEPEATETLLKQSRYGFNDRHQGVFATRQEYQTDMIDLKNADFVLAVDRAALRIAQVMTIVLVFVRARTHAHGLNQQYSSLCMHTGRRQVRRGARALPMRHAWG